MFKIKSEVAERNKTLLRKKEINKLRSDALAKFTGLTEENLNELLPSKGNVEQSKLMNKTILYYVDGIPMFFDEHGRNRLYPTLQLLWRYPKAVRTLIIHSQVSKFVLNGADLMLPGVALIEDQQSIEVGDICSVRVYGNPLPFAIGQSTCSNEGILVNHRRGKALEVLSCFNDLLCGIGMDFTSLGPNSGFIFNSSVILPLEDHLDEYSDQYVEPEDSDNKNEEKDNTNEKESAEVDGCLVNALDTLSVKDEEPTSRSEPTTEQRLAMNYRLRNALILLLKHVLKDKALPALINVIWPTLLRVGEFLYNTEKPGLIVTDTDPEKNNDDVEVELLENMKNVVDIKRSQYRSVLVFMKWAAQEGILTLKEDKEKCSTSIETVIRTHILFRVVRLANPDALREYLDNDTSNEDDDSTMKNNKKLQITVTDLYKMPQSMKTLESVASNVGLKLHKYLSANELKEVLMAYFKANKNKLENEKDRASVIIPTDDLLWEIAASAASAASKSNKADSKMELKNVLTPSATTPAPLHVHVPVPVTSQLDGDVYDDPYDDPYTSDEYSDAYPSSISEMSSLGGSMVAGVWMSDRNNGNNKTDSTVFQGSALSQFKQGRKSKGNVNASTSVNAKHLTLSASSAKATLAAAAVSKTSSNTVNLLSQGSSREEILALRAAKKLRKNGNEGGDRPNGPATVRKDELMKFIVSKLSKAHSIQKYPGAVPLYGNGPHPKVDIIVQMIRAKKFMTHIYGLDDFGIELAALAREVQKKFAASASVGPNSSNPQKSEVYIQGNVAVQLEDYLVDECGLKRSMISIELGKGCKPKKK
jgi:predicted RNA-binding protein (TIGR00451 family)